ncbi:hypothetical protein [Oceanobacillus senegalensis]|uniref:hypothetical protein n=1 Tax=Oceanobacillus senegalensis TaxID=1936063 RepID=UPI000A31063C|nr:hypothetical protein [Oceanobacillus senegalensis]
MIQTDIKNDTSIKLPLAFILFALFAFVIAQGILLFNSTQLLTGQFRIPEIWMSAHFLLLGFAVMVAMGAMYQLVPVTFLTPIWNPFFGIIQFIVTSVGISSLSILLGIKPNYAIYGGVLAVLGIIMFVIQMIMTLRSQKEKSILSKFIGTAIICFFLTIVAGLLLAGNIAFGGVNYYYTILKSHIVLGIGGWFTLLIFGFSYKLIPMFSLSHGFSMKWAKSSFVTYIGGIIIVLFSFWTNTLLLGMTGWLFLFIGFTLFILDIKEILRKRIKKKLDKSFSFSLFAILIGWITHILAIPLSLFQLSNLWGWLIYLYIMGWIIFSILGYLYKIVPFLWWTHKYSERIGKEKVPTMKDMMSEKLGSILFCLFTIGVIGSIFSALFHFNHGFVITQGVLTATSIGYCFSIIRVLYH